MNERKLCWARGAWPIAALLLLSACGCRHTTKVSGGVNYKGRAVMYGSVTFVGPDKDAHSGVIDSDGTYTIDGLRSGDYLVAVISRDPGRAVRRSAGPSR